MLKQPQPPASGASFKLHPSNFTLPRAPGASSLSPWERAGVRADLLTALHTPPARLHLHHLHYPHHLHLPCPPSKTQPCSWSSHPPPYSPWSKTLGPPCASRCGRGPRRREVTSAADIPPTQSWTKLSDRHATQRRPYLHNPCWPTLGGWRLGTRSVFRDPLPATRGLVTPGPKRWLSPGDP